MNEECLQDYLSVCEVIDYESPSIQSLSVRLRGESVTETAHNCFRFVRDQITHSGDAKANPVTLSASSVLKHGTGYCYAKSHLLAALLRANGIPAALCYQRLLVDDDGEDFCLHGLNAIHLPEHGWYRVDARGNRDAICAEFSPPQERVAFPVSAPGESDLQTRYARPLPVVVELLARSKTWDEVLQDLPDIDSLGATESVG